MTKKELLLHRLIQIGESVQKTDNARALFGLGSVGVELERIDEYSDLDFFVIAKPGKKQYFLQSLLWLSDIHSLDFYFLNTVDGYKVLFEDDIYGEFAIFEEYELEQAHYAEGRIVWCEPDFDTSLRFPKNSGANTWQPQSIEWGVGEILSNLYVGLGRYLRGEKLSGYIFVERHAFSMLIELIEMTHKQQPGYKDIYNRDRRFEFRHPEFTAQLPSLLQGYDKTAQSALAILEVTEKLFGVDRAMKQKIIALIERTSVL